ncbi:hypothetical protein PybrP1_002314 [[Pythium] brassicae (nom. inval.)]|nr:hypothetical protein PybrP1_002314 [[Pythium] brassicae (nom. inval.)]
MLGYAGENELVLVPSSSDSSDSDADFAMDPSDPRAHDKNRRKQQQLRVHPTRAPRRTKSRRSMAVGASVSRWDSDSPASGDENDDGDEDEDIGERVPVRVVFEENAAEDTGEEDEPLGGVDDAAATPSAEQEEPPRAAAVKLSKWALSRFLVPREERTIPVFEELPIEPLNDHILSDFSSRHRGRTGDVEVAKVIESEESEDDDEDKLVVGAPLYSSTEKATVGDASGDGACADKTKGTGKNADSKSKPPSRRRPESRYFVTDLATKCFNCGQIGHMSSLCMNDRECSNSPPNVDNCGICGRPGHEDDDCELGDAAFQDVSCMVCVKPGHLHCVPIPPPADRKFYCPNCAEKHLLSECSSYVEPSQPNYATSNFRMAMKCFSGRKRGRDEFNSGDYDEDVEDDDYHYQVPGGGYKSSGGNSNSRRVFASSKSYSDSTVRLDSALPSYRSNGGGGHNSSRSNSYSSTSGSRNGSGYKSNGGGDSDRRRGGNGGGRWR